MPPRRFYQYNGPVAAKFDLHLTPFYRIKGLERPQYPGLLVSAPPKRAARGREDDRLIVYLSFSGNTPFTVGEYKQIAEQMAQHFYANPGSLTAALRSTVESLNQVLVERNLRTTGKGQYLIGRAILGVLRESQLVLAQCGPTHVFHLSGGQSHPIHDPQISGKGLGIGQSIPLHFAQADLHPGDLLVLCAALPGEWEGALLAEVKPTAEALRRRLVSLTNEDLNAILVQVAPGRGALGILPGNQGPSSAPAQGQPPTEAPSKAPASSQPATPAAVRPPSSQVESGQPASRFTRLLAGVEAGAQPEAPEATAEAPAKAAVPAAAAQPVAPPPSAPAQVPSRPNRFITPSAPGELPELRRRRSSPQGQQTYRSLARLLHTLRGFGQRAAQALKSFLPHLLPNLDDESGRIPGTSLAFIAVAVPILVVMVAFIVYKRLGQTGEYTDNFNKAIAAAENASVQTDPLDVRRGWETTLYFVNAAETYQVTQDSETLRQEAQAALDNLDEIVRLDFHPAIINGLSRTIQVSHMAATDSDLYLLNSARGNVMRAFLTSQGYEIDTSFKCDPGSYAGGTVGPLIDIAALPKVNDQNAAVLAMDANATLLYCAPNADPVAVALAAPELGWQGIASFVLDPDAKTLYVLDPPANAVWVYAGNFGSFPNLPTLFFGAQVPQNMNTAIDLAANGDELYLLFKDGHVTSCTLSQIDVVPTRCTDPVTFVDSRPGQQSGKQISDAVFSQITFAPPPDPSLYLFEPLTQAIYRFSPQTDSLTLQGQFQASEDQRKLMTGSNATAIAISPNRYLFLSLGSQIYYATDVP